MEVAPPAGSEPGDTPRPSLVEGNRLRCPKCEELGDLFRDFNPLERNERYRDELNMGKKLAIDIIIPGIDYWSKQALSLSAGERESKAYKDRAEDLKELRKQLVADSSALLGEVEAELPFVPRRLTDTARVQSSGLLEPHVTPDPMTFPGIYAPPEETTTG